MSGSAGAERIRDADGTRRRILDAARREFGLKGFDGARVEAIARRARVTKGLIFYYFQSKEELFRVLSEQRIASARPMVGWEMGGQPIDWPLGLFDDQEATEDWVRYFLWEGLTLDNQSPENLHQRELRAGSFGRTVERVRTQQEQGHLPASLDARQLTFFLYVLGVYPYILPQMAYLITGALPDDEEFRLSYVHFVRGLAELLAFRASTAHSH